MSEYSYRQKVRKGLAGHRTSLPVCFPAACERILPRSLRDETYLSYAGYTLVDAAEDIHKRLRNRLYETALNMIAVDVGLDSHRDISHEDINSETALRKIIKHSVKNDIALVLEVDAPHPGHNEPYTPEEEPHAVGLLPVGKNGEQFRMRSSWLPHMLKGVIGVDELWPQLIHHSEPYWSEFKFHNANTTLIPIVR